MKKRISILGSTGSIGQSTLALIEQNPDKFRVQGLVAGKNIALLAQQIDAFQPQWVSIQDEHQIDALKSLCTTHSLPQFSAGVPGACDIASDPECDLVISAIVGSAGLKPTLAAIEQGTPLALANKESLVVAGAYVMQRAKAKNVTVIPIDSEHSAIFQCLQNSPKYIHKLVLTASGGPFFTRPEVDFNTVSVEAALAHPNWRMGPKISIDSATMMNKGLETIEARWLFDISPQDIEVVVHPQSIVHSMVTYVDGSTLAQLSPPDMKGPISLALAYPDRLPHASQSLSFEKHLKLEFFAPDHQRFPSLNLAKAAMLESDHHSAVLNGANESAVDAFLNGKIRFADIFEVCRRVVESYPGKENNDLESFIGADQWGRTEAEKEINQKRND